MSWSSASLKLGHLPMGFIIHDTSINSGDVKNDDSDVAISISKLEVLLCHVPSISVVLNTFLGSFLYGPLINSIENFVL